MKFLPHFPKLSFGVILICFLLPFVVVKCNNVEIAKLNGLDFVTGTEIVADSDVSEEAVQPNLFIIVSLVMAAAGLALAFMKFRGLKITSLIISVLGFASLIAFYFDMQTTVVSGGKAVIILTLGTGYYIATIAFLINSIFFGYTLRQKEEAEAKDPIAEAE